VVDPGGTLSEHEALQRALEAGRMGTWSWSRESGRVSWDPMLERLFGFEPGAFPGTHEAWLERVHPDDREDVLTATEVALREGRNFVLVHRILHPDGETRWIEGRADVILDAAGDVVGLRGISLDVSLREEAARGTERLRVLLDTVATASRSFTSSLDPDQVLRRLALVIAPRFADGCEVALMGSRKQIRRLVFAAGEVDRDRLYRRERTPIHLDDPHPIAEVLRTGHPVMLDIDHDVDGTAFGPAHVDTSSRSLGITSAVIVPLEVRGAVIGALALGAAKGRAFDEHIVPIATELAQRAALAYDNARLYLRQRTIAETLQHSLLPTTLPYMPGLQVAARYWAAGVGSEVGGDFYDVVTVPDTEGTRVVVLIGDVCGKGVEAAAVTAMARHTLRAAVSHGTDLAEALLWLHEAVIAETTDRFVTAALVQLRVVDGIVELESAVGGHPRPIVVRADGTTEELTEAGTAPGMPVWRQAEVVRKVLAPGDAVVLYTDGLTDVPGDAALTADEVRELVGGLAGSSADEIATELGAAVERLRPRRERDDDIAIVVVKAEP
jgi:serine phosphatase RsbU (regulator of sigma subunit)